MYLKWLLEEGTGNRVSEDVAVAAFLAPDSISPDAVIASRGWVFRPHLGMSLEEWVELLRAQNQVRYHV
jgi:hypothetical protein